MHLAFCRGFFKLLDIGYFFDDVSDITVQYNHDKSRLDYYLRVDEYNKGFAENLCHEIGGLCRVGHEWVGFNAGGRFTLKDIKDGTKAHNEVKLYLVIYLIEKIPANVLKNKSNKMYGSFDEDSPFGVVYNNVIKDINNILTQKEFVVSYKSKEGSICKDVIYAYTPDEAYSKFCRKYPQYKEKLENGSNVKRILDIYNRKGMLDEETSLKSNHNIKGYDPICTIYIQYEVSFDEYPVLKGYSVHDDGNHTSECLCASHISNYDLHEFMEGINIVNLEGMLKTYPNIVYDDFDYEIIDIFEQGNFDDMVIEPEPKMVYSESLDEDVIAGFTIEDEEEGTMHYSWHDEDCVYYWDDSDESFYMEVPKGAKLD